MDESLRREVGLLRSATVRRTFAARVAAGTPGLRGPGTVVGGELTPPRGSPWPPGSWLDAGLRLDVVERLLGRLATRQEPVHLWLLRPGHPALHDEDLAWLASARHAASAIGIELAGFWVVTRYGWLDPVGGVSREWKRLRVRR